MRSTLIGLFLWVAFLGLLLVSQVVIPSGYTRIELVAEEGGKGSSPMWCRTANR